MSPSHKSLWKVATAFSRMMRILVISRRLKYHPEVYTPNAWYEIIKEARTGKKPFSVTEMAQTNASHQSYFLSTQDLERSIANRKVDTNKEKVSWLNAKQIRVVREKPKSLFFRYSHEEEEEWKEVDLRKRGTTPSLGAISQSALYQGPRPISSLKKKDILSLLPLIPPCHHEFYTSILSIDTHGRGEDVDGLPDVLDFVVEDI